MEERDRARAHRGRGGEAAANEKLADAQGTYDAVAAEKAALDEQLRAARSGC